MLSKRPGRSSDYFLFLLAAALPLVDLDCLLVLLATAANLIIVVVVVVIIIILHAPIPIDHA